MKVCMVGRLKVKPGAEKRAEEILKRMVEKTREEKGTLAYIVHRLRPLSELPAQIGATAKSISANVVEHDPTVLVLYEVFEDEAAVIAHGKIPDNRALGDEMAPLLVEPSVEFLTEIAGKWW